MKTLLALGLLLSSVAAQSTVDLDDFLNWPSTYRLGCEGCDLAPPKVDGLPQTLGDMGRFTWRPIGTGPQWSAPGITYASLFLTELTLVEGVATRGICESVNCVEAQPCKYDLTFWMDAIFIDDPDMPQDAPDIILPNGSTVSPRGNAVYVGTGVYTQQYRGEMLDVEVHCTDVAYAISIDQLTAEGYQPLIGSFWQLGLYCTRCGQ